MENFKIAYSDLEDAGAAVKSIKEQLSDVDACMVLYFASTSYPPDTICREMADAFTSVHTVGCTTYGEMISCKMGQNSIVATAWSKDSLKFLKIEVLENIKEYNSVAVAKAFKSFEESLGIPMKDLDPERYAGIVIIDGVSECEEELNDNLGNRTNVPFVGGSASDDFKFERTWLFVDGKAYANAAILILMEPTNGYSILKTQSFKLTDKKLTPTKVNERRRMVLEFDGKPALLAYAEALEVSVDEVAKHFIKHPVGLVLDEQNYFVRSPISIEGTSVIFHCVVKEDLELTLLQSADILSSTRSDLQKCGKIQAVVEFNCSLRFIELNNENHLKEYSEIFKDIAAVGFATYGESYIGHMNQTSTMLLLR